MNRVELSSRIDVVFCARNDGDGDPWNVWTYNGDGGDDYDGDGGFCKNRTEGAPNDDDTQVHY